MYIFLLLLIGAGIFIWFAARNSKSFKMPGRKSPQEILDERFASGEIDEETYRKMKEAMKG